MFQNTSVVISLVAVFSLFSSSLSLFLSPSFTYIISHLYSLTALLLCSICLFNVFSLPVLLSLNLSFSLLLSHLFTLAPFQPSCSILLCPPPFTVLFLFPSSSHHQYPPTFSPLFICLSFSLQWGFPWLANHPVWRWQPGCAGLVSPLALCQPGARCPWLST